ncbi:hypothetical protein B7P43_G15062, partial [Cryptotermes secundus]
SVDSATDYGLDGRGVGVPASGRIFVLSTSTRPVLGPTQPPTQWVVNAIVVHKSVVRSVVKKIACNDRIIALKLKAEPVDILIMQVYMPTSEYEDYEMENVYDTTEEILQEDGRGDTNSIILGDWNSIVADEPYQNIVWSHGLGRRNHRGQMLIDFCERNGLIATNTWSKKPKGRIYTRKAPGVWRRHQLHYILVKHRFRNSVKVVKILPGADIDPDHKLLVAKIRTRLKKIIKFQKQRPRWDFEKVYSQKQSVQETLEEKLGAIEGENEMLKRSGTIKECMLHTICDLVGKGEKKERKP